MITPEEKITLAKEVGLDRIAHAIVRKAETAKAIQQLTGMKFKRITSREIENKLPKFYRASMDGFLIFLGTVLGALLGMLVACVVHIALNRPASEGPDMRIFIPAWVCFSIVAYIGLLYKRVDVRDAPLQSWEDELPYGALLAIKEAKEQGIHSFYIHYPVDAERERLRLDPIITGLFHGIMLEIFAWDDGKIYE